MRGQSDARRSACKTTTRCLVCGRVQRPCASMRCVWFSSTGGGSSAAPSVHGGGGGRDWWRRRLWKAQARRPLSSTVRPPTDHGSTWSTSQSSTVASHRGWKHSRSGTSTDRRVAPVKMRRRGDDVHDPVGTVEDDSLDPRLVQPGHQRTRAHHPAVGQLAHPSLERLVAHQHGEQRLGQAGAGGNGHRLAGHLHQGVGPALGRGAGQVGPAHPLSHPGLGLGPVGGEQLLLDGLQGPAHDVARDGVEDAVEEPGPSKPHDRCTRRARCWAAALSSAPSGSACWDQ